MSGPRWRRAVGALALASVAVWPTNRLGYTPNPEYVPVWLWGLFSYSCLPCVLVLALRRARAWFVVLAWFIALPVMGFLITASVALGTGRTLRRIQGLAYDGRAIPLVVEHWAGLGRDCTAPGVLVAGGVVLQRLGFTACSSHNSLVVVDTDSFAIEPGPRAGTFALSVIRTRGDEGAKRVTVGVYRFGTGGRLVRVKRGTNASR